VSGNLEASLAGVKASGGFEPVLQAQSEHGKAKITWKQERPVLLFIEPPLVTDLPKIGRRPVAFLFVLGGSLASTQKRPALRFHSPGRQYLVVSPTAQTLSCGPVVSWGRSVS
jgi:hypothetical protein